MFNFVNEFGMIKDIKSYRYMCVGGKKLYIQGFKSVLSYEKDSIVLKLKEGEFSILGNNLDIEELSSNSILISGDILTVKVDKL